MPALAVDRPWASLVVALTLLLAGVSGCLVGEEPGDGGEDENGAGSVEGALPSEMPARWALEACKGYSVQAWVPTNATRDSLPEGFQPASEDPQGQAQPLFVDVFACDQATLEGDPLGEASLLTAKIEVRPPEDMRRAADAAHYLYLTIFSDSQALIQGMQAAGLPARHATPSLETLGGPARVGTGSASHADVEAGVRVATGDLAANELAVGAEQTRAFGLDRVLGAEGTPTVRTVIDRDLSAANITAGEGNWSLSGPILPGAFPEDGGGVGFDTQEGTYGETFRVRPIEEAAPTGRTEASSPSPALAVP